jgi:ATP-dependent Clp protease ATP-binding subunit ClpC
MANVIKPDLAKGTIQMIGATTLKEYKRIEKDGALERRFQKIIVAEPTKEETYLIIKELKDFYGNFHKVEYTDDALLECVNLSERYLPNKVYPDKATDLMDEVGAVVKLQKYKLPDEITSLQNEVLATQETINVLVKDQNYEKAGEVKKEKDNLITKINGLLKEFELTNKPLVEVIDVQKTISTISGIPINKINKSEKEKILHLEQDLKSIVVGQDNAIEILCKSLKRHSVGIGDFSKPIGKFIFLGSSGCGKTFCVKELGKLLFGTSQAVIRLDMSEYMEKHSVSKIIGSPPGYVGHESGGGLTEKVKHNPYSIILLDEIEKAHVDVLNLFLQIFDEGTLTDSLGAKINFKNTIIIGTSNLGTSFAQNPIGFGDTKAQYKNKITDAFNKFFSKEFINRVDDIIIFNQLEKHDIHKILDLQLNEILNRLNMNINIDDTIKDFLIEKGYSKEYGVRELKRTVQKYIEDELADNILSGTIQKTDTVYITYKDAIIINNQVCGQTKQ